jgi:lipopolysaccharide/colanic/teichoic acid biosynthesis glycosyltransferase
MSPGKRLFDLAGALAGLVVFAPALALIALAVKLDDGGRVLFRQERLGLGRRRFSIVKFRTMRGGKVTRVGRVLRATGLDEIPQFVNILRGDMSAVGPRPLTADDVERLGWTTAEYDARWSTRPGLTGVAQLVARRAPDALAIDRAYVAEWHPAIDCQVIVLSLGVNVFGKDRVRRWLQRSTRLLVLRYR